MTKWRVKHALTHNLQMGSHRGRAVVSARDTRQLWVTIRRPANDNPVPFRVRLRMAGRCFFVLTIFVTMAGLYLQITG